MGVGGGGILPLCWVIWMCIILTSWPPFLTLWGLNSIFLEYFFSSTNTKTIFWDIKTTNHYRFYIFGPKIHCSLHLWVQFWAASGTPPSVFGASTSAPPPPHPHPPGYCSNFQSGTKPNLVKFWLPNLLGFFFVIFVRVVLAIYNALKNMFNISLIIM